MLYTPTKAEVTMSRDKLPKIGRLEVLSNPEQPRDDRDPEVVGLEEGLATLNAGLSVVLEDVKARFDRISRSARRLTRACAWMP